MATMTVDLGGPGSKRRQIAFLDVAKLMKSILIKPEI
jgi:hypothetical protein